MKPSILLMLLAATFSVASAYAADPCQGPAFNVDLQKDMPPIDDQGGTPWCATFSARGILDYNAHLDCLKRHPSDGAAACTYKPDNRVSLFDVNSLDSSLAGQDFGQRFSVDRYYKGADEFKLFEGVQKAGVLSEQQLPFDQSIFNRSESFGLILKLSDYYDRATDDSPVDSCSPPQGSVFSDLRKRYPDIQNVLIQSTSKSNFIKDVSSEIPNDLKKLRKNFAPPFNIVDYISNDPVALKTHVLERLKQAQPLTTGICMQQFAQRTGLYDEVDHFSADPCGPHAMIIIGFRKTEAGKCEIHLRNSFGAGWPQSQKGDGNVWVDVKAWYGSLIRGSGGTVASGLTSLQPRDDWQSIANQIITPTWSFTGQTWQKGLVSGTLTDFATHDRNVGRFESTHDSDGNMSTWIAHGTRYTPNGDVYEGDFDSNGRFVHGTKHVSDGTIQMGDFIKGGLACGTLQKDGKIWCVHDGSYNTFADSPDPKNCGCQPL